MSKPVSAPVVISAAEWKPSAIRYMQPKVNDRGGKSIAIISTQSNRSLHLSTPLLMTWGIADFVDEKTGESDGKYSMSLNFPSNDYSTPATTDLLNKLKEFENQILDDAVRNSEAWFGEEMSREVAKHTFFPFLKYSKDKVTKKFDFSKPPSMRAKVPNYDNRWAIEIYDTSSKRIFPIENPSESDKMLTPMDFIPKQSNVACVLQCGGLWFGGKGWGLTWKLNQCVVKPREIVSVFGRCHIQLSTDEISKMDSQVAPDDEDEESSPAVAQTSTEVEDSGDEGDAEVKGEPEPEPVKPLVKKVVKKAVVPEPVEEVAPAADEAPKKKTVVKKKVVA